jgi:hypothetical protein
MHLSPRFSLIATLTKHDIAGIVIAVVAVALLVAGGAKLATKAVKGGIEGLGGIGGGCGGAVVHPCLVTFDLGSP